MVNLNPHISVDCVIFGFNEPELSVLLIERDQDDFSNHKLKLPGNLIRFQESLKDSANRVLFELTGLKNLFLKQFGVFDHPNRLKSNGDLEWLRKSSGINVDRVITIAYYSLINISESRHTELSKSFEARWYPVNDLPSLIFDHNDIIETGLKTLQRELLTEPLGYELLPKKFSLNQLQRLYEAILGIPIDNRNFRKKINRLDYIIPLNEFQTGVAHKPARLNVFDRKKFDEFKKANTGFII
jgi:hypothetical protein